MAVVGHQPALGAIIAGSAQLEVLWRSDGFFEGPVWFDDDGGFLLFSDIHANAILRWSETGGVSVRLPDVAPAGVSGKRLTLADREVHLIGPNGLARDPQGRLVYCSYGAGEVVRSSGGKRECLAARYRGQRLNTPNDLVFRSDGILYFTDSTGGKENGVPSTGVYRLRDGSLDLLIAHFVTPNGLAFSPDERFLYINDTRPKTIARFAVAPDGTLDDERPFADLNGPPEAGSPDGMKVDLAGNVYCTGPGGLWIFAASGTHLGIIRTPEQLTNCAFGGSDRQWLFLTGPSFLYRIRLARAAAR
jgi:gluconolactonase